jgi:hypothetical protein
VVVLLAGLVAAVLAGGEPGEIGGQPDAKGARVGIGPRGGGGEQGDAVAEIAEMCRLDDADAAAGRDAGNGLRVFQVRIHACGGIKKPHPQEQRGVGGVGLVSREGVGQRKRV